MLCSLSWVFPLVREMCRVARKAGGTGTLWRLQKECRLVLQKDKTEVLSWDGTLQREAPAGMVLSRLEMEGEWGALITQTLETLLLL